MADSSKPRFKLTRRKLILGGTLAGGALVVGTMPTAGGPITEPGPLAVWRR